MYLLVSLCSFHFASLSQAGQCNGFGLKISFAFSVNSYFKKWSVKIWKPKENFNFGQSYKIHALG